MDTNGNPQTVDQDHAGVHETNRWWKIAVAAGAVVAVMVVGALALSAIFKGEGATPASIEQDEPAVPPIPPENWYETNHALDFIKSTGVECGHAGYVNAGDFLDQEAGYCTTSWGRYLYAVGEKSGLMRVMMFTEESMPGFLVMRDDEKNWSVFCLAEYEGGVDEAYRSCNAISDEIPGSKIINSLEQDKFLKQDEDGKLVSKGGTPLEDL